MSGEDKDTAACRVQFQRRFLPACGAPNRLGCCYNTNNCSSCLCCCTMLPSVGAVTSELSCFSSPLMNAQKMLYFSFGNSLAVNNHFRDLFKCPLKLGPESGCYTDCIEINLQFWWPSGFWRKFDLWSSEAYSPRTKAEGLWSFGLPTILLNLIVLQVEFSMYGKGPFLAEVFPFRS